MRCVQGHPNIHVHINFSVLSNLGVSTDSRYLSVTNSAASVRSFAQKPCGLVLYVVASVYSDPAGYVFSTGGGSRYPNPSSVVN